MIITELENDCKKEARKVFEEFKRNVLEHPFTCTQINKNITEDAIEFFIYQKFGSKLFKKYTDQFSTPEQFRYVEITVSKYKLQLLAVARNWSLKQIGK